MISSSQSETREPPHSSPPHPVTLEADSETCVGALDVAALAPTLEELYARSRAHRIGDARRGGAERDGQQPHPLRARGHVRANGEGAP